MVVMDRDVIMCSGVGLMDYAQEWHITEKKQKDKKLNNTMSKEKW